MENLKTLLNKCNDQYDFVKVCDLEKGKKYEVTRFKYIDTIYGKTIVVILDKKLQVFLPDRFLDEFTKENISLYNLSLKKFNLVYNGLQNLDNGRTKQLIQFE